MKHKIIFDATVLVNMVNANSSRSGICLAVYNILVQLCQSNCDMYLYTPNKKHLGRISYLIDEDKHLSNCKLLGKGVITYCLLKLEKYRCLLKCSKHFGFVRHFLSLPLLFVRILKSLKLDIGSKIDFSKFDAYISPVEWFPEHIEHLDNLEKYIILYDTIPLTFRKFYDSYPKDFWFYKMVEKLDERTKAFAISQSTKNDFLKYCPKMKDENITVIPLATNDNFYKCNDKAKIIATKEKYNIPLDKKYIFSLCTIEPRKNLLFAIKNFLKFIDKNNINDFIFVLGGGHWDAFLSQFKEEVGNIEKYKDKIVRIGYVDDEDLSALYSDAFCFVYPSLYEGFGLPPLEAMKCGAPVITSDVSSLPEVVGDDAIKINPKDDVALQNAYKKLYENEELRVDLANRGLKRAELFSWKKTADIIVDKIDFDLKKKNP